MGFATMTDAEKKEHDVRYLEYMLRTLPAGPVKMLSEFIESLTSDLATFGDMPVHVVSPLDEGGHFTTNIVNGSGPQMENGVFPGSPKMMIITTDRLLA